MPRKPGAKSTQRTVDTLDGLLAGSFVMDHEEWLWRRPCVLKGCDHRMGPAITGLATWKSCDETQLPAHVVHEDRMNDPLGILCPCHTAKVMERQY